MYIYISMLALGFMDAAVAIRQVVNAGCAPKDLKHFEEQLGKFGGDVKMEAPQPLFVCVCACACGCTCEVLQLRTDGATSKDI